MGLDEVPGKDMDVAHHDVAVHVAVSEPALGFGSFLRVLVSQLKLGPDRGVPVCRRKDRTRPIFFLSSNELVAGRDNKHMDFRLSIMKMHDGIRPSIVVSTLCMFRNKFGQYYLSSNIPFHKFGLRRLMASALSAQRL